MKTTLALVLSSMMTLSMAQLEVQVMLLSYSNTRQLACEGDCLDGVAILEGACDNTFEFCVREVGTTQCLASKETNDISSDELTFTSSELETLDISNPVIFTNLPKSTQLELLVNVTDLDSLFHDEIDQFVISLNLLINDMFSDAMTYRGTCNQDTTLELKIKISDENQSTNGKSSAYKMSQATAAVSIIVTITSFLF